jgi:hypothetical protein
MKTYQSKNGKHTKDVTYCTGRNFIEVTFGNSKPYRYTYSSAGEHEVKEMKRLAKAGEGLLRFINKYARMKFERAPVGTC